MSRIRFFPVCLMAGWLSCSGPAGAEDFLMRNWQSEDGLADNTVTAIQQTPDGYLWLGTTKGLVRFDGMQFTLMKDPAVRQARIGGLLTSRSGALWINCETGPVVCLRGGRFTPLPASEKLRQTVGAGFGAGVPGAQGATLWMWSGGSRLAEADDGTVWAQVGERLLQCQSADAVVFTPTNGLPEGQIAGLCADHAGQLWLAAGQGLYARTKAGWVRSAAAGSLGGVLPQLAAGRNGGVWVASPHGSWEAGGGQVRLFKDDHWQGGLAPTPWVPNSLRSQITALLEDRAGRVWLGTLWGGVYFANPSGGWQRLPAEAPISQCVITCLFEDAQGAIWVGTVGEGLWRVTRKPVVAIKLPPPASENIITASCATRDGGVWAGTDGAGAFRRRQEEFVAFGVEEGLASLHVCSIFEDRRTNLWFGTWGGLFRFEAGRFSHVEGPAELRQPVLALFEDRAGHLWIGTRQGLVCWNRAGFQLHSLRQDGGDVDVRSLAQDAAGDIWVGTIGTGLFRVSGDKVDHFDARQGFAPANARSLFCDHNGVLWIGSDGAGLFCFQNGAFRNFASADGLPADTISSIIADDEGRLWMGSDNGIFQCPQNWLDSYERGRSPAMLGVRLGLAEGLGSRGCSGSGQPVPSKTGDGRLWFPNMRCLAVFDPRDLATAGPAPQILVESVTADGKECSAVVEGELRVPSSVRRFEFRFTAPAPSLSASLRFRHKLEGMDREWVETGPQRVAGYSQLPPGVYRFHAMVGGADGRWQESAKMVTLRVVPRLWELRWVQVLAGALVVAAVAGGLFANDRRKLRRQFERLEMQQTIEQERRRIARDLHDDLGAQLTEIVLLGELARRGGYTPGALQGQIGTMTQKVRQLVTAMEEIVWTVNPKHDSLAGLSTYLCDYTERFLASAQLSCRLDVAADLPPLLLTAQLRHNLLLAVKEALSNAARHAAATQVRLRIGTEAGTLCVAVQDDGRGFAVRHPASAGNGLQNMRLRLASLGGATDIQSRAGQGTEVVFRLPLERLK